MNEKDITKTYWKIVWEEVKRVSREDDDMRGHKRVFLWILFLATCLLILFISNKITIDFFENALGNLGIEIILIVGPLVVSAYSLIRGIIRIPARLYEKQGGFLENPFSIEVYKPERRAKERENKWVSLQINNILPAKPIERCHVRLDDIFDIKKKKSIIRDQQNLTWSGREHNVVQTGNQPLDISSGDFGICDVAKAEPNNNSAYYTMWFGKEYIEPGEYILSLTVFGNRDGYSKSYPYNIKLIFEGSNEISLSGVNEGKFVE